MKQGLFVLVTDSEDLVSLGFTGVMGPDDFLGNLPTAIRAVIIDQSLPEEEKVHMESACVTHHMPFFYWSVPDSLPNEDADRFKDIVLGFLNEQNEWKINKPSPETMDKIELQTLIDIITTANSHLQPQEVMHSVMTRINKVIPCKAWSVLILDNNAENTLSFAAAHGPGKKYLASFKVPFGQGIAGWVAKNRQPVIVNDVRDDPRFLSAIDKDTKFNTQNILCAPLVSRGRTIGVIEMLNREGEFSESDLELVQTLVNPAAVAIENAYLFQKAQTLTIQDDLTQLFNSRHLNQCLESEIRRAKRTKEPLTLIFLDLDGFKQINDNYGHPQGSKSLIEIAKIIKSASREMDIVGRYGGDEFVLILPATDTEGAIHVGERIRNRIETYTHKEIRLTASIGIASYPRHATSKEALIRLADQAMYRVKERGKNGIMLAHDL